MHAIAIFADIFAATPPDAPPPPPLPPLSLMMRHFRES